MTKIEAHIRSQRLEAVQAALESIQISEITVTETRASSRQRGATQTYRGSQFVLSLGARVKVELLVRDEEVDNILAVIQNAARTGDSGDGQILVIPVSDALRIQTGERGESAVS